MKKSIYLYAILFTCISYCQESIDLAFKDQIFSFSPIHKTVKSVNGIVIGVGHFESKDSIIQNINGLNIDVNPLGVLAVLFVDPSRGMDLGRKINHNGLHLSLSGYHGNANLNGLGISLYHFGNTTNGICLNAFYHNSDKTNGIFVTGLGMISETANGIFISGIGNDIEFLKGISIGATNSSFELKGLQIGGYNLVKGINKGIQIGLFNHSKAEKGLQLGLWNVSNKRSLPLLNW